MASPHRALTRIGKRAARPSRVICLALALAMAAAPGTPLPAQSQDSAVTALRWRDVATAGGVIALAVVFDAPIARRLASTASSGRTRTAQQLDRFGEMTVIVPVVGGLALIGTLGHHPALTRLAARTAVAIAATAVATQASKRLIGRARPFQDPDLDATDFKPFSNQTAMPSGHAAAAFALATSLGDAIPSRWARAGLYVLAGGTAWARMAQEKHWLSDVVAGGAIGVLSARLANGRLSILGLKAPRLLANGVGWSTEF